MLVQQLLGISVLIGGLTLTLQVLCQLFHLLLFFQQGTFQILNNVLLLILQHTALGAEVLPLPLQLFTFQLTSGRER